MAKSFTELKAIDAELAKNVGLFRKDPNQANFDLAVSSMLKFADGMDSKVSLPKGK